MRYKWVVKSLQCDAKHRWTAIVGPGKSTLCPECGQEGHRPDAAESLSPAVFGDTLWGGPRFIHNLDTEPVWVETKSQYHAELKARGFENRVRHVETPGTGKSDQTQSWITGPPPGWDVRPFAMLTPEEQAQRHAEWIAR